MRNTPVAFTGCAGTGKTHELVASVAEYAKANPLADHQAILGLTFMHGARARLDERFSSMRSLVPAVECKTMDSFCLDLVRRFRYYAGLSGFVEADPDLTEPGWQDREHRVAGGFDTIRAEAVALLTRDPVQRCVALTFPIVVVDEFQDCSGAMLEVAEGLTSTSRVFVAGDEFQFLESGDQRSAAATWMAECDDLTELTHPWRTTASPLVRSANALRAGVRATGCIPVVACQAGGLAAWQIASRLAWQGWATGGRVVILSPVGPEKSRFVRDTLRSLRKRLGKKRKIGPFLFSWEASDPHRHLSIVDAVPAEFRNQGSIPRAWLSEQINSRDAGVRQTARAARRTLSLRGGNNIALEVFADLAQRTSRAASVYSRGSVARFRRAMTIHSAKNREFEYVAVLWPYEVMSDMTYRRKLLYNAITRAKKDAVVIVQGDESSTKADEVIALIAE